MRNLDDHLITPVKPAPDLEVLAIKNALSANVENTQEEKDFFAAKIAVKRIKKGTLLLESGQIIKASYHVFKGCIREFYHKHGEEKTSAFYTVGDSLTEDSNQLNQTPSLVNWECSTECIISIFPFEVEKEMYRRFPRLESQCRIGTERMYSEYRHAINNYLSSSPEERYEHLMKTKPEVFQAVPLYYIASYLGVKPESLSRIRRRLRNKFIS